MDSYLAKNLFSLSGKVALVTGGGSGIGLMIARALAANGAKVYIVGRRKQLLEKVVQENNSKVAGSLHAIEGDVSSKESLATVASSVSEDRLDVLVNNAGMIGPKTRLGSVAEISGEAFAKTHLDNETFKSWTDVFQLNISAVFFGTMTFLPLLCNSQCGNIINISSISGCTKWSQDHYAYNASKAAVNALTSMLAHELNFRSRLKIRVNALGPGFFESEMTSDMVSQAKDSSTVAATGYGNPCGRMGTVEEMSSAILFLATNTFVTGQILYVDGGFVTAVPSGH